MYCPTRPNLRFWTIKKSPPQDFEGDFDSNYLLLSKDFFFVVRFLFTTTYRQSHFRIDKKLLGTTTHHPPWLQRMYTSLHAQSQENTYTIQCHNQISDIGTQCSLLSAFCTEIYVQNILSRYVVTTYYHYHTKVYGVQMHRRLHGLRTHDFQIQNSYRPKPTSQTKIDIHLKCMRSVAFFRRND